MASGKGGKRLRNKLLEGAEGAPAPPRPRPRPGTDLTEPWSKQHGDTAGRGYVPSPHRHQPCRQG